MVDAVIAARSPLAHALPAAAASGNTSSNDSAALVVRDLGTPGLLALRGRPERSGLNDAVVAATGLALPERLASVEADGRRVRWLSPDHFLLSGDADEMPELAERIEAAATGTVAAIDMTGAYLVLELGGGALASVLAKSAAADLHPDSFPSGKVVSTVFAKATATLTRLSNGDVELIVRRSFADYVWLWLQGASTEHGLVVASCD